MLEILKQKCDKIVMKHEELTSLISNSTGSSLRKKGYRNSSPIVGWQTLKKRLIKEV